MTNGEYDYKCLECSSGKYLNISINKCID